MTALRILVRAALLCAGAALTAVVLSLAGWWMVALFTSVGFGFLAMSLGEAWLDPRRGSTTVAGFGGLVIVVAASVMSLGSVEVRLWPYRASGLTLERARDDFWASSFAFSGARPKPELGGEAPVLGRYGSPIDTASVVPVVDASWTPEDPVFVWAVARKETRAERARLWRQPMGVGLRVSGFFASEYEAAAKVACARHQLRTVREPLFIEWTPTPQASLLAAWRTFGTMVLIATLAVFMLIATMKLFQPRRHAR